MTARSLSASTAMTALTALTALSAPLHAQFDAGIPVGSRAPVVAITDLDGKPVDLGRFLGKQPVVIEFWATWCPVCKGLLPRLEALRKKYGDRVAILGVNITVNDSKEKVRRYLARHGPPYTAVFYDEKGIAARAYDAPTTSYTVVVDPGGIVTYTGSGEDQDLVAAVDKALSGKR